MPGIVVGLVFDDLLLELVRDLIRERAVSIVGTKLPLCTRSLGAVTNEHQVVAFLSDIENLNAMPVSQRCFKLTVQTSS